MAAEPVLRPAGALARGPVARALGERLLHREGAWQVAVADGLLVALGEDLPWVDGVQWLGTSTQAHGLWLPTTQRPALHLALVARAVSRRAGLPAVLLPSGIIPLRQLGPLHRPALESWLAS